MESLLGNIWVLDLQTNSFSLLGEAESFLLVSTALGQVSGKRVPESPY